MFKIIALHNSNNLFKNVLFSFANGYSFSFLQVTVQSCCLRMKIIL